MTITRVGTNQKYSSNWDSLFGGKKKSKTAKSVTTKTAKKGTKAVKKNAGAVKKKAATTVKTAAKVTAKPAKKAAKAVKAKRK